jgi:hypothetical protein
MWDEDADGEEPSGGQTGEKSQASRDTSSNKLKGRKQVRKSSKVKK